MPSTSNAKEMCLYGVGTVLVGVDREIFVFVACSNT
jgi:hypothetical protein